MTVERRRGRWIWKALGALAGVAALAVVLRLVGVIPGARIEPGTRPLAANARAPSSFARAERVVLPLFEEAPGTVESRRRATVASQGNARVVSVALGPGQPVAAGEELARLDDRELAARLDQARAGTSAAAAASARAVQARAQADAHQTVADAHYARMKSFVEKEAATAEQLEAAEAEAKAARAEVTAAAAAIDAAQADERRAAAAVAEAEVALGYAKVVAPIDGAVVERLVEPGDLAWPGRPLFVVNDPKALRLSAQVREGLIARIAVGDRLAAALGSAAPIEARVAEVLPLADPRSRTFEVRAEFDAPAGVHPGIFGRLRVPAGSREIVRAPVTALRRIGQLDFAFVRAAPAVERRFVTLGERFADGTVEILSGLKGGEELVLEAGE
jgi:RND family efflux transporter MFP subunit